MCRKYLYLLVFQNIHRGRRHKLFSAGVRLPGWWGQSNDIVVMSNQTKRTQKHKETEEQRNTGIHRNTKIQRNRKIQRNTNIQRNAGVRRATEKLRNKPGKMKSRTTRSPSLTTSFSSLHRCKIFHIYLITYLNFVIFSFLPPTHLFLHSFCPNRYRHLFLHLLPRCFVTFLAPPPLSYLSSPISALFCANSVIFPHLFLSLFCQLLFLTCFCTLSPPSPLRYSLQPHRPLDEAPFHLKEDKKHDIVWKPLQNIQF